MKATRAAAMITVSAIALAMLYWLALAPYQPVGSDMGLVRLSWRMRGQVEEKCRNRTAEELEKLPIHMRTPTVCERESAEYVLRVHIDGREVLKRELIAAGAKGDRPIYVLEEFPLEPGLHHVRVVMTPGDEDDEDDDDRETGRVIVFDDEIRSEAGKIDLIGREGGLPFSLQNGRSAY